MTSPAALRALVATLATTPPAVPSSDADALAPLLDAQVADVLRALDDVALLRLCAPVLWERLLLLAGEDDAPPEPVATPRTRSTRRLPVLAGAPPVTPREPRTQPVRLVVLPVEALTAPGDRFRCEPFAATLTAAVCVERQRMSRGTWARSRAGVEAARDAGTCERCGDCATGRAVAARVGQGATAVAARVGQGATAATG